MTKHGRRPAWAAAGLLALVALLPAFAANPAGTQQPNLQGKWKLNEDLTARMREEDRPQGGPGGFRGGPGRRPGGGGPGGGGPGGGGPGGGFPGGGPPSGGMGDFGGGRQRGGPPPSLEALDELTIVQTEGQVTITDKEGRSRALKTDGSKFHDEQGPGGPAEIRANWEKGGSLTVKIKPDEGPKRTESYVVANDRKHLYLTLTLEREGREFKVRRAYDPVVEESGSR